MEAGKSKRIFSFYKTYILHIYFQKNDLFIDKTDEKFIRRISKGKVNARNASLYKSSNSKEILQNRKNRRNRIFPK